MEHIENYMVMYTEPEEKALEECECCGCELFHGDKFFKIGSDFYCESCVDTGELDADNYLED